MHFPSEKSSQLFDHSVYTSLQIYILYNVSLNIFGAYYKWNNIYFIFSEAKNFQKLCVKYSDFHNSCYLTALFPSSISEHNINFYISNGNADRVAVETITDSCQRIDI